MSEDFQLQNDRLTVRVRKRGAELCSLRDRLRERELLWQGDPSVWAGTAPILFPVVGRMRGGGFYHCDQFYEMPIHGFAADSDFSLETHTQTALTLHLTDNAASRAIYPFAFDLRVHFELSDSELQVGYEVQNPAQEPLIFSLGSHPAFALPAKTMGKAGAEVRFDRLEKNTCHRIRNHLLGGEETWPVEEGGLALDADTFAEDAIILRDVQSRNLTLHARGERLLTLDTGGAPHLGLWAKPDAPYLCIEPWLTTDDAPETPMELSAKPGFITLSGHDTFCMHYRILV